MLLCVALAASSKLPANDLQPWVRAWGVALMAPEEFDYYPGLERTFADVTLRQFVRTTLGGTALRVSISNQYGSRPLRIAAASIACADHAGRLDPKTTRPLLFNGQHSISIPAGTALYSDTVPLSTAAHTLLAISVYLPDSTRGSSATVHEEGWLRGQLSQPGDFSSADAPPVAARLYSYFYVAAVDVIPPRAAQAIVVLGDSLSDGTGSTPWAERSWPDRLARRVSAALPGRLAVINMAIGGNRLLHDSTGPNALSRADRDVFAVPGVRYVLVLEGINDIIGWPGHPDEDVSAAHLCAALHQLLAAARAHSLRAIAGTLTPTEGCMDCGGIQGEAIRQSVNTWIRSSHEFDAVVDFDRVVRDPMHPRRLAAAFDSGDHLHLSDAGYAAMARAVDLELFADRMNEPQGAAARHH